MKIFNIHWLHSGYIQDISINKRHLIKTLLLRAKKLDLTIFQSNDWKRLKIYQKRRIFRKENTAERSSKISNIHYSAATFYDKLCHFKFET